MYPDFLIRSNFDLGSASRMLSSCSDALEIRMSPVGVKGEQSLGMFAKRDIISGTTILDSPSATGVSSKFATGTYCYNCALSLRSNRERDGDNARCSCCPSMQFCSTECTQIAEDNYHSALCGRDFSILYKEAAASSPNSAARRARDNIFLMRALAISVQAKTHPLATAPISWLMVNDDARSPVPWSRENQITGPLQILEVLGVDVFVDERYDVWVLQTIWYTLPPFLL